METIIEEKIETATDLLAKIYVNEEKQVIVNCNLQTDGLDNYSIRIWPTIYLIPRETNIKCSLIKSFNIAIYPVWQNIGPNANLQFTLLFAGLPSDCKIFDILEIIPEQGGFEVRNIIRNVSDVYYVNL